MARVNFVTQTAPESPILVTLRTDPDGDPCLYLNGIIVAWFSRNGVLELYPQPPEARKELESLGVQFNERDMLVVQ